MQRKEKIGIGTYIRNEYGIGKIIDISRYESGSEVITFDNNIVYFADFFGNRIKEKPLCCKFITWNKKELENKKHNSNIYKLLEHGDIIELEFYSPRYKERIIRTFVVEKWIDNFITFSNSHATFDLIDLKFTPQDKRLKPIIKSIITKEALELAKYKIGE